MVFNWFRRQYSASEAPPAQAPTEPQEEQAQPAPSGQKAAPENVPQDPATPSEDYLSWAKAAYKNIQQKQQVEPETPEEATGSTAETPVAEESPPEVTVEEPPTPEPVAEAAPVDLEPTPEVSAPPEVAAIEPTLSVTSETPQPELVVSPPALPVAESPVTEPDATPEATAAVPLWLRSETERQERIERLKETAIAEPEPVAAATQPDLAEYPAFAFDEGFLWSAEILASQGRRPDQVSFEEITWLQKLRRGLERTRRSLINQLKAIVGQGPLNQDAVMEIEALLLQADVGVEATDTIITALQKQLREEVLPPEQAIAFLKKILRDLLDTPCQEKAGAETPLHPAYSLTFAPEKDRLNIWLIVGVNGAGKTTTIGKIAHLAQKSGYKTLIAAADTFRAAAVEQVKVWGSRSGVEIIANPGQNTDPAAVVFDAIAAAQARGTELLIVDTAGRLQNKKNLMDELSKIRRIVDKKAGDAIVESLLVLDATLGQNGLRQAEVFSEAAQLSGVVLTKLDGTAKGGVALAVVKQLGLPIRFIGVGESIEDLRPFSSYEFVEALLNG
ncbi:MAG: signal recognition particle-docking protein FtsY [Actinomycetota bacterium]